MITHRGMSTGTSSDQNGGHGPSFLKKPEIRFEGHMIRDGFPGYTPPTELTATTVPFPAMQRLLIGQIVLSKEV